METVELYRAAIKELLKLKGLNQSDFAEAINETQSHVSEFLNGGRTFHTKHQIIANFLGISYIETIKYGQILLQDPFIISHLSNNSTLNINGKEIKVSEIYSKVRIILSSDGPECGYLISDIDKYYKAIQTRKRPITQKPKKSKKPKKPKFIPRKKIISS